MERNGSLPRTNARTASKRRRRRERGGRPGLIGSASGQTISATGPCAPSRATAVQSGNYPNNYDDNEACTP
eukprot:1278909-Prymnesium_polylepis.1